MPYSKTQIVALTKVLKQQLEISQRMLACSVSMTEMLIANNVAAVVKLEKEQRRLCDRQCSREHECIAITADIAVSLGIEGRATLAAIIKRLPVTERPGMARLRSDLLRTNKKLMKHNERNKLLLDSALDIIRHGIDTITRAALKPAKYGTNLIRLIAPTFYIDNRV